MSVRTLAELRAKWREFHTRQDRVNAERIFEKAGIDRISTDALAPLPAVLRSKLTEFGREWERALALEAHHEAYSFYRARLRLKAADTPAFYAWIQNRFEIPGELEGTALFFESDGPQALKDGVWEALFYFAIREETMVSRIGFDSAPGVVSPAQLLGIA